MEQLGDSDGISRREIMGRDVGVRVGVESEHEYKLLWQPLEPQKSQHFQFHTNVFQPRYKIVFCKLCNETKWVMLELFLALLSLFHFIIYKALQPLKDNMPLFSSLAMSRLILWIKIAFNCLTKQSYSKNSMFRTQTVAIINLETKRQNIPLSQIKNCAERIH